MSKHSALHIGGNGGSLWNEGGRLIAQPSLPTDGEELVRRWNAHDDLLAAVEAMQLALRSGPSASKDYSFELSLARAAIAKVRGGK